VPAERGTDALLPWGALVELAELVLAPLGLKERRGKGSEAGDANGT
jgi:hypothetical protein